MASNKIYGNPTVTPINVKNVTEVKEGSIGMEHLSQEVLDNLGGGEGNVVVVHATSKKDDNSDEVYDDNGKLIYEIDKDFEEIRELVLGDNVVYLDVSSYDFSVDNIPYTATADAYGEYCHLFSKPFFIEAGGGSNGGVLQYGIDENNKLHEHSFELPTGAGVDAKIAEQSLKLLSDRVNTCTVAVTDYDVDDDGVVNRAMFSALWQGTPPSDNKIPIGSSLYILLSDGAYHLCNTTKVIYISTINNTDFFVYSDGVDTELIDHLRSGRKIEEGSDMYVILPHSYYDTGGGNFDLSNYLSKNNKDSYTPSTDYNPATKKYVDDSVNVVIQNTASFGGQIGENSFYIQNLTSELHDDYYNKNEVDNAIAEVNETVAEIDVPQIDGEKSKTDTIAVFEDVRTEVIEANENGIIACLLVPREDSGVVQYILEFDTLPSELIEVYTVDPDGNTQFDAENQTVIDVNDPKYERYGGIDNIYIHSTEGTSRITVTKMYGDAFLKADIEKGSIEMLHLSDDAKARLVKKTDYATKDVAGAVKVDRAKQGLIVNDDGELRVYCAEKGEVEAKSTGSGHKPISIQRFDYALSLGTHQTMNDDYVVSTGLKVHPYHSGIQEQLPASYTAVKGYVDGKFAELAYLIDELRTKIQ